MDISHLFIVMVRVVLFHHRYVSLSFSLNTFHGLKAALRLVEASEFRKIAYTFISSIPVMNTYTLLNSMD